jgi:release factor glutamine methyltransferase
MNIAELLCAARARLATTSDTPAADAEILLACALAVPRSYLYTWPERMPAPSQSQRFEELLGRRQRGEPVAYLVGRREFWSLELTVTPATLIPRPETELLVELALERLPPLPSCRVADLGTGSGAVALALASAYPAAHVIATDTSWEALAVAQGNARRLGIDNVEFRLGDWCAALRGDRMQMIVSNPPYVADDDPHLHQGDVRFEPRGALQAGSDGLAALRRIITQAAACLETGGWLLLEHGCDQGEAVAILLRSAGFAAVGTERDGAGRPRVACGRRG